MRRYGMKIFDFDKSFEIVLDNDALVLLTYDVCQCLLVEKI